MAQYNTPAPTSTPTPPQSGTAVGHGGSPTVTQGHPANDAAAATGTESAAVGHGGWTGDNWSYWWYDDSWNSATSWKPADDREDRPYLNHLTFPSCDGSPSKFDVYQYDVKSLKWQCSTKDLKFIAPKLISQCSRLFKMTFVMQI